MLDNLKLGYGGTQQEMYRLLTDAKKLDETFDAEFSLSAKGTLEAEFADIIEAIHIVQENMGITGATADEAASTISGSLAMTKAAWKNLLVGIADPEQDMGKLTENLITSIVKAAENIIPRAGEIVQGIGGAFSELAPMIGESFQEHITPLIGDALSQALDVVGIEISGEEITKKLNSAFSNVANDVGKGLSTVQQVISDNKEEISSLASEITELLGGIGTSAKEALSDVDWSAVFGGLLEVSGTVVGEANDIWAEFEKAGEKIKATFDGTDWGEVFSGLKEAAKEAIEGLGDIGAESVAAAGNIVADFTEALNVVVDSAQTDGSIANKITEFLKGQFTKGIDDLHLTADVIEAMFDDSVNIDGGEIIHQLLEKAFSSPSSITQSAGLVSAAGLISTEIVTAVKNAFNNPEVDQLAEDFSGRIKAALTGDPYPTPKLDFSPAIDAAKSAWASIVSMFSGGISVPVTYVVSEDKTTTPGQSTGRTTPRGNQILVRDESTITMASDSDVEKRKQAAINQANAEAANKKAAEAAAAEYAKNKANTSNTKKNAKGAILNRATIFGKVGETYQIGGEAGAEAVAPIETLQNYVSTAVAEVMAGQNAATAEAFAMSANAIVTRLETLADEIADAMGRTRISINGREFGRLVREV